MAIQLKDLDQLKVMRRAGIVVAEIHQLIRDAIKPGMTTSALDAIASAHIKRSGATSNFLNYHGFPATICDVVLLPGAKSLLAPNWVPYSQRIQPGDLGVGDVVPTSPDDERLTQSYAALPGEEELDLAQLFEFGLSRARVLSIVGRDAASKRWYEGDRGPRAPIAQSAPKPCSSCGFFIPIAGSLRSAFGVCANAISPEDARVVSVDHGCGAHSEALIKAE